MACAGVTYVDWLIEFGRFGSAFACVVESLLTNAVSSRVISTACELKKFLYGDTDQSFYSFMQFLSFIRKLFVVGEVVIYLYSIISISHHDHLVMSNTFDLKDDTLLIQYYHYY